MIHLTRRYRFSASHRLHNPQLSEAENVRTYGKCNNPGGHGHNYFLEVTLAGEVDPRTGMLVNLSDLDSYVQSQILDRFDRINLNDLQNFSSQVPTTENLCLELYRLIGEGVRGLSSAQRASLERIRLEETSSNFFEVVGDGSGQRPAARVMRSDGKVNG